MAISNLQDINKQSQPEGDFQCERQSITAATGSEKLGASVFTVPPGKKAFPYHTHHANEEMIYVISGKGSLRTSDEGIDPIKAEDFISLLCGSGHQVINDSDEEPVYLCFSTMIAPDVMEYPDSNKVGVMSGSAPGGVKQVDSFKAFFNKDNQVGYFEGEE